MLTFHVVISYRRNAKKDVIVLVLSCENVVLKFVKVCYMVQNFENVVPRALQARRLPYKSSLVPNNNTCFYKFKTFPEDMKGDNTLQNVYTKHVTEWSVFGLCHSPN